MRIMMIRITQDHYKLTAALKNSCQEGRGGAVARARQELKRIGSHRTGTRCVYVCVWECVCALVGGVTQRGKGDESFGSSRGLEFLPSCSPHLAGTCENNSPAFSHSADPIAISTSEGVRARGNPDRQNTGRKGEESFNQAGQMPRPVERLCDINIS